MDEDSGMMPWDEDRSCWCCGAVLNPDEAQYCGTCQYCNCRMDDPRCDLPLTSCQECGATNSSYDGLCAACYADAVA